jgi:hypothetical protein
MRQYQKPALQELHNRLYQILPEYKPISQLKHGQVGTWKAITSDGDVFLVTWSEGANEVMRQEKAFFCDYDGLRKGTAQRAPGPEDGWNVLPE